MYNLHGESAAIARVIGLIEEACPAARGSLSHVGNPLPFPAALADHGYQRDLGPKPRTALAEGIQKTIEEFERLKRDGRLDARELS